MNNNQFEFPVFSSPAWIITFIVSFLILLFWVIFAAFGFQNKKYGVILGVFSCLYLATLCLGLSQLSIFILAVILILSIMLIVRHFKEFKNLDFSFHHGRHAIKGEKLYDREKLYGTIEEAVQYFSQHRIGALITFVKRDSLEDEIRTGVHVDAPVSLELLQTIFYVGTRLHDGAVIIDGDKIVAAACLYQPSTEPVSGKLGLRHRAALGISETSDAVTVVVSEETGRISLAYKGELQPVMAGAFKDNFIEIMEE